MKPVKECQHPDWSYGEVCVQCNACGRFDKSGASNPVRSDIKLVSQYNAAIPEFWQYPKEEVVYLDGEWQWLSARTKNATSQQRGTLEETLPPAWYPERLDHVRWWIEGRNY